MPARSRTPQQQPSTPAPTTSPPDAGGWAGGSPDVGAMDDLHDTMGNAAVGALVQRMASGAAGDDPQADFSDATGGAGGPVPYQAEMERSFGEDFSSVQAHTGQAAPMKSMGAKAAASGDSVAFAEENPSRETVAHELTHVVQNRGGGEGVHAKAEVSSPSDSSEREADAVASRVSSGGEAGSISSLGSASIHRHPEDGTPGEAEETGDQEEASEEGSEEGSGDEEAEELEEQKQAFEARDMALSNHTPSTGIGKFDAQYNPAQNKLVITLKVHFEFTEADDAPGLLERLANWWNDVDDSKFFWTDQEKQDYASDFTSRVQSRWSGAHTMRSTKPDWEEYTAATAVDVQVTEDASDAHYAVTVHKSSNLPQQDYNSGVNNENLTNPSAQPTADLWQSDVTENADFNSGQVATQERQRIDAAIGSSGASVVHFEKDSTERVSGDDGKLDSLADALNQANPSAPMIPLQLDGYASADGDETYNQRLSQRRADAVRSYMQGKSVKQPLNATGQGEAGAENDASQRKVQIATDTGFESGYSGNRYSVAEHEAGHMFGLPDEYTVYGSQPLQGVQTQFTGLVVSAGLNAPTYGEDTSSQMSNGVDVLPQHYVTFWEALGKMTPPDIQADEWAF